MRREIESAYEASKYEDGIYRKWYEEGVFDSKVNKDKESFFIPMPPPNATGKLHLGHATMIALQDIMIRFNKMNGKEVLWLPGTDHAAIATQSVVEKKLVAEGMEKPREVLGREALLGEIKKFVEESKSNIKNQVRKMGAGCDWKREKYTLDEDMNEAVNTLFKMMMEDGLIYRGGRIVNWDPNMKTTVADDELEYKEETTKFYYFQYGPFVIGTARPETKFGDKYVLMHPEDERYKEYKHGDTFECEWINGKITATVIKDESVDPEFGSGVMTITPWHSAVDFEIAQRHGLDLEQVIDFEGNMLAICGEEFEGMNLFEAREKLVKKLDEKGLLVKVEEDYQHNIAVNYRGKGVIEPQVMKQWFIDVNKKAIDWKGEKRSIKEVLQDSVRSEMIELVPGRFEKIYFHWIDNLRDWCISRQIWWGHQIPVWYKASKEQLEALSSKKDISSFNLGLLGIGDEFQFGTESPGDLWVRDPDTLDTWFSAALWTFATLGWPEKTEELEYFHPAAVLETGYDIIFFWVARMILASTYALRSSGFSEEKSIPFKKVYLHGLIRDRFGKKMSKSRPETCIDPLEMIEKYGADALRLSLVIGSTPGNDMNLYEEKIAGYRNFVNKIWNASRFALMNLEEEDFGKEVNLSEGLSVADKWILTGVNRLIEEVNKDVENNRLSDAGTKIYEFMWKSFCDWYLEISKVEQNPAVLVYVLRVLLRMLHPFVPFVTEQLWSFIDEEMIVNQPWPEVKKEMLFEDSYKELEMVQEVINSIRSLRAESKVSPAKKIKAVIYGAEYTDVLESEAEVIVRLARLEKLEVLRERVKQEKAKSAFVNEVEIYLPLEGLVDSDKERKRLEKELKNKEAFMISLERKLSNEGFVKKAPEAVIAKEKGRLKDVKAEVDNLREQLKML